MTRHKAKGIGLLSGGLDSILAVKVLQEQDLDLRGVIFRTPFFGFQSIEEILQLTGIPVRVVDIGKEHLEMLKKPFYGYGKHLNPCIDCHALMLREAGRIMEQEGLHFLFTGEVMGQRPMSQRRDALHLVEKMAGYPGRILRPLSAKLLPPTTVELEGLVDRERLLDIHGRSRKRQMALVEYFELKHHPQPGGGCMLTKEGFVRKLKALFQCYPQATLRQVEKLKWGRHFLLPGGSLLVVGRQQQDNDMLESLADEKDILVWTPAHRGPTGVMLASLQGREHLSLAAKILISYSDAPIGESVSVQWRQEGESGFLNHEKTDKRCFEEYMV